MISPKKDRWMFFLIFSIFFITVFTSSSNFSSEELNQIAIRVFYFNIPINKDFIIEVIILIIAICIIIYKKFKIKVDIISSLLFIRLIFSIIPLLYKEAPSFIGNFMIQIIDLMSYLIAINYLGSQEKFLKIFRISAFIIAIQVIFTAIFNMSIVPYKSMSYKSFMLIPFGGSNFIGTIILPILSAEIISLNYKKNKIENSIYILVLTIGILLTKSRTCMILLSAVYIVAFAKFFSKDGKYNKLIAILITITLIIIGFIFINDSLILYLKNIFSGFSSIVESGGFLNRITSGRIDLYKEYIGKFIHSPVWGNGCIYDLGISRSHNLIIDILYQSGIVGILFLIMIVYYYKIKTKKYKDDINIRYMKIVLFIFFINSMSEISILNSVIIDYIVFSILGYSIYYKNNNNEIYSKI